MLEHNEKESLLKDINDIRARLMTLSPVGAGLGAGQSKKRVLHLF